MNPKKNVTKCWSSLASKPLLLGFAVSVLAIDTANANWHLSPEISVGTEFDDNVTLDQSGSAESDTAVGVQALVNFLYDTQLTDFTITPALKYKWYRDNSDLDSDDQYLNLDFIHTRERSRYRIRADYSSESIRTAERNDFDFDIDDPRDIPGDDTGRVADTGTRDRIRLAPEFTYDSSERTALRIFGRYQDSNYDSDIPIGGLTDFQDYQIGASFGFNWTEKDKFTVSAYTGSFDSDAITDARDTTGAGVEYMRTMSERTQLRFFAGAESTDDLAGNDQSNPVGEVTLIHNYITSRIVASYRRSVNGSGAGAFTLRDTVSLNFSRDVSPRLTLSGGIRAYQTSALDSSNPNFAERDFVQIRALASWNMTRKVTIDLDYKYTDIKNDAPGGQISDGDSNVIGIWLRWRPILLPN